MARRIQPPPPPAPAPAAASEMEILHPERQLTLDGQTVVVREYGNVEWLRLLPRAEPLVAAIAEALEADTEPTYEQALQIIAGHVDALLPLIAQAADRDAAWIETLDADEVELLLMTWWGVNAHFFVRRAGNRVAVAWGERRARAARAGAPSTPPSSPTATGAPTSVATPSAS